MFTCRMPSRSRDFVLTGGSGIATVRGLKASPANVFAVHEEEGEMAVPKKRKSRARTRMRRAQHDKIKIPGFGYCPNCGEPKQPHRVCLSCGNYKGRNIVPVVEY